MMAAFPGLKFTPRAVQPTAHHRQHTVLGAGEGAELGAKSSQPSGSLQPSTEGEPCTGTTVI